MTCNSAEPPGSGKTYTAANVAYRLIRFGDARRLLFLVDRANLGRPDSDWARLAGLDT